MSTQRELATRALRGALTLRRRQQVARVVPICVYKFAEALGLEVRFYGGSSFEGMYHPATQAILVPRLRPPGRQAFACAHELGHWYFGHGTRIDTGETLGQHLINDTEERLANLFAGYLLMPPWAVADAFERRGWTPTHCTPLEAFVVARQLGVGYTTLIQHMGWSLRLLIRARVTELLKTKPKDIRHQVLGDHPAPHLVIADHAWHGVAVDLRVGDATVLPIGCDVEGASLRAIGECDYGAIFQAILPGISRATHEQRGWATFVRVSHSNFLGRSIYRHFEDPDVDTET